MLINYGSCAICFMLNNPVYTRGNWQYAPTENQDQITLTGYIGNETTVTVPDIL